MLSLSRSRYIFHRATRIKIKQSFNLTHSFPTSLPLRFYAHSSSTIVDRLPLVDRVTSLALQHNINMENMFLVGVMHGLNTAPAVPAAAIKMGIPAKNIYMHLKAYSTVRGVPELLEKMGVNITPQYSQLGYGGYDTKHSREINELWRRASQAIFTATTQGIIVLAGGYDCLPLVPAEIANKYPIVGITHSSGDLSNRMARGVPFPLVDVGGAAVKKILEPPIIMEEIYQSLAIMQRDRIFSEKNIFGVVGYGTIGKALVNKLSAEGYQVLVYDKDSSKLNNIAGAKSTDKLSNLIAYADYIFCCSGTDITERSLDDFEKAIKPKLLINCGSGDREVRTLLIHIQEKSDKNYIPDDIYQDVLYTNESGALITIANGGFVFNFSENRELSAPLDIQLTRALNTAGILQAAQMITQGMNDKGQFMLDPHLQKVIAAEWLMDQTNQFPPKIPQQFNNVHWIQSHSDGKLYKYCPPAIVAKNKHTMFYQSQCPALKAGNNSLIPSEEHNNLCFQQR